MKRKLINNLINLLKEKGYIGVNVNTPYILPEDRSLYESFIVKLYNRLAKEGFKLFNTFTVRVFQLLSGTIFTRIDFSRLSEKADGFILITYEFGYSEGIPPGTSSLDTFRRFLAFSTRAIPPEKTFLGISVIGYLWTYPYIPGESRGLAVSYESAIELATIYDSEINFDETTNTAYFQFISDEEYIVRFWDARSIANFVKLVPEFGLRGISIWNIMSWFSQLWIVINDQYHIESIT
jgi:spore germination protein